jgi:hypothetical protein
MIIGTPASPPGRQSIRMATSLRYCQHLHRYRKKARRSAAYAPFWNPSRVIVMLRSVAISLPCLEDCDNLAHANRRHARDRSPRAR